MLYVATKNERLLLSFDVVGWEDDPAPWSPMRFFQPVDDLLALGVARLPKRGTWPAEWPSDWNQGKSMGGADSHVDVAPEHNRVWDMARTYGPLFWVDPERFVGMARSWKRQGLPETFEAAAREVEGWRLPQALAPWLSRVHFSPEMQGVSDLPTLAAWTLLKALDDYPHHVIDCELCGVPWLAATKSARYCHRLAPGSFKTTCLEIARVRDFRARKKGESDGDR